jgi:hypothetical protein
VIIITAKWYFKWIIFYTNQKRWEVIGCLNMVPKNAFSRHGGVAVSVLTTEPKGRGFKPGQWIFKGDKMKPEVPCRKILRHVKDPLTYLRYRYAKIHSFAHFSNSLPDISAGRIARELWWTSQEFSPAGFIIITMALHAHIPGILTICPLVAQVLRRLTPSTW